MGESEEPTRADVEGAAARYLSRRDHARGELRDKLLRKDYPAELVEDVLDDFESWEYLDDRKFAAEQGAILARKCWGPRQIAHKLRARGIDEAIVDEALATIGKKVDWREQALERLTSRFGDPDEFDDKTQQKAYRHLTYRGYSGALVRRLLFD